MWLRPLLWLPTNFVEVAVTKNITPVYYTRCPVPTASGIAFQRGMFDETFEGSAYRVRNIVELGPDNQNVHYTHSIDAFFREGGGAPPVWAKANGVDSVLLAMTFVDETLGIFVRADDRAETIADLAGRRIALPVWPRLVFNFWRFVALHGILTTLEVHAMSAADVRFVDVTEGWDPNERRNVALGGLDQPGRCEYRNQLEALKANKVDAVFGKGPEAALLVGEAKGSVRLLTDLRSNTDPDAQERICMPRLLTTSNAFLNDHPEAVVAYIRTLIRASRWADENPAEAATCVAAECAVRPDSIGTYVGPEFHNRYLPRVTPAMLRSTQFMVNFLHDNQLTSRRFDVEAWVEAGPLAQALALEGVEG
jgi:sulfonate transport system substrate-binding protein